MAPSVAGPANRYACAEGGDDLEGAGEGGGMRWAAGEEFDTSPKRIKTPACAVRGAVLSLPPSPSHHFFSEPRRPFHPPSLLSARAPSLSISAAPGAGQLVRGEQVGRKPSGRRRRRRRPRSAAPRLPVQGATRLAAGRPWFGEPGGILALRAKKPVFSVVRGLASLLLRFLFICLVHLVIAGGFPC